MIQYSLSTEIDSKQHVHSLAYSTNGRYLAVSIPDGIKVYHTEGGGLFLRVYTLSAVLCLCWNAQGDLSCGCETGHLAIVAIDRKMQVSVAFMGELACF